MNTKEIDTNVKDKFNTQRIRITHTTGSDHFEQYRID